MITILLHHYRHLMGLKVLAEQMKEEEQPKEVLGADYITNTGTLDRYLSLC